MVSDRSYLCGSEVFCSFPVQVSVKVGEDICSATAPFPHTTHAESAEGFVTGSRTYIRITQSLELNRDFRLR